MLYHSGTKPRKIYGACRVAETGAKIEVENAKSSVANPLQNVQPMPEGSAPSGYSISEQPLYDTG